ncbi:Glyoxalase/bleomycin resistance protein/dioxygenase [[Leptolyngbya] sp. PCC 7376]|uniref:VOC family protein n=1 Tax=[Leptolyngbya] sp. PCC 7376 TaxID=111781 RepID=UPI00029F3A69|nr:VOC family protein [[Leptolyngbya] sp. PCC 7376]AFY39015.1 Glyoxalase/bleomycin resistance protein/dioxygenase [[Leptolyngbya] sp. PCC 7376]
MQLNYVVLYVDNLQKSFEFYSELGFELTAEQHGEGPKHYSFPVGNVIFEIYLAKNNAVSHMRLGIEVDINVNGWDGSLRFSGLRK